jgi:hypothetical protein
MAADSAWVASLLLAQSGKTYRIDAAGDGSQGAMREVAVEAARALTDEVVRAVAAARANGHAPG